jgi:hypothetical protein
LHLELIVRAGELVGRRRIDARSCEDLAGAAAVALALLLRSPGAISEEDLGGLETDGALSGGGGDADEAPEAGSETERDAQQAADPSQARPESARPTAHASSDAPSPSRAWRGLIRAPLGAFGLGPLPEPTFGLGAAAGITLERWRFLVEGTLWKKQRLSASDDPGVSAGVQLFAAGLRTCWAAFEGPLQLGPCATLTVEHVRTRGDGDHVLPATANVTWLAGGIGAEGWWRLAPWLGLVGGLSGQIEGSRPRIVIDDVGTLGQVRPVSMTLTVGVEWIL